MAQKGDPYVEIMFGTRPIWTKTDVLNFITRHVAFTRYLCFASSRNKKTCR